MTPRTPGSPRKRLTPEGRRAQLLAVGSELFAARPYEEVLMEDVAEAAGVSRALLYRHFASKRDLFVAIYQQVADKLLAQSRFDPADTLEEQLTEGLDAHISYFAEHRNTVIAANRTLAGDRLVQTVIATELDALRERLLDALGVTDPGRREAVSAVLKGWLVFVQVLCVDWLERETCTRVELREVAIGGLRGALGPLLTEG
ncbi:TetR/AcrR family transcriptional regulator [Streptomyces sp. NBC_00237]|uniref:TetR/AcrR family transcriptional regulator n=1 Tax=Streptomyces sp. NBC_00237 TaxID=2975687 RepID=UPI002252CD81|nr:TetR/AcrR family transcriptional regulator [Streptomyces sp. NBC_00237]MCX5206448.1 TetR/AcrR family transcriptional regulator [Streptomyces sp. NBC_00237]